MADPIVKKFDEGLLNPKTGQLGDTGAGYGTEEGQLVDYNGIPIKMTGSAPTVHNTLANAKNPLEYFLRQGALEQPGQLSAGYDENAYSFGKAGGLGMADPLTSALRGKMQRAYSGTVNDIRDKYMRGLPLEQAKRAKVYQSLADSQLRAKIQRDAEARAKAEADAARKKAKKGAVMGTIGAIGGGIAGGMVGGPAGVGAGAQIGGGLGGALA